MVLVDTDILIDVSRNIETAISRLYIEDATIALFSPRRRSLFI